MVIHLQLIYNSSQDGKDGEDGEVFEMKSLLHDKNKTLIACGPMSIQSALFTATKEDLV